MKLTIDTAEETTSKPVAATERGKVNYCLQMNVLEALPVKLLASGLANRNNLLISLGSVFGVFAATCSLTSSRTIRDVENE